MDIFGLLFIATIVMSIVVAISLEGVVTKWWIAKDGIKRGHLRAPISKRAENWALFLSMAGILTSFIVTIFVIHMVSIPLGMLGHVYIYFNQIMVAA